MEIVLQINQKFNEDLEDENIKKKVFYQPFTGQVTTQDIEQQMTRAELAYQEFVERRLNLPPVAEESAEGRGQAAADGSERIAIPVAPPNQMYVNIEELEQLQKQIIGLERENRASV